MADTVKTSGLKLSDLRDRVSRSAGPLGPVVGSTIGVLRESAGLVCNVAGLGIALVSDAKPPRKAAPRRLTAPGTSNVVAFPTCRTIKPVASSRKKS